jgi:two-component system, OmpR family, alkaline phosphatase synthesis response regulator PhoP
MNELILVVEDERHLADGLRFNLEAEEYRVETFETGEEALARLAHGSAEVALVLLDVMLPGMDGFAVVSEMRKRGIFTPVMMLTARGRSEDILTGFASGADDYLPKPFDLEILLARARGLLRRSAWLSKSASPVSRLELDGKTVDLDRMELISGDTRQPLTLMETNLLRFLAERDGQTVSRSQLLEGVWGVREDTDTRAIDNFIVRLRRYIERDPAKPRFLTTVRGVGYRFELKPND